jgi:hypothetical protein
MNTIASRLAWLSAVVLLLGVCVALAEQNMYRWTDAEGRIHYSDRPPPPEVRDYKALTRSGSEAASGGDSGSAQSLAEKEAEFAHRRNEQAKKEAEAEKLAAERRQNCELARANYNTVSAGGRITRRNAQGEVVYLTDEEIEAESSQARVEMEKWCDS